MRRSSLAFSVALSALVASVAASAPERPVLVELFTSQGCSSYPPAEEVLLGIAHNRADVLALGFHAEY